MKNRILTLFRNNVPYIKELRTLTGSVTASILMQQLDYWFERSPNGFYKFLNPCPNNKLYKKGDSWTEELGFSKSEFKTAFEKIGITYKSKKEFTNALESGDLFQGKFYCCYLDKMKYITVYYRNDELLESELEKLLVSVDQESLSTVDQESLFTEIKKVDLRENEFNDVKNKAEDIITVDQESASPYIKKVDLDITEITTEKETTYRDNYYKEIEFEISKHFHETSVYERDLFMKELILTNWSIETIKIFLKLMQHREKNGEKTTTFSINATILRLKSECETEDEIVKTIYTTVGNAHKGLFNPEKSKRKKNKGVINISENNYKPLTPEELERLKL